MHDLNRYHYPLMDSLWHPISELKDYAFRQHWWCSDRYRRLRKERLKVLIRQGRYDVQRLRLFLSRYEYYKDEVLSCVLDNRGVFSVVSFRCDVIETCRDCLRLVPLSTSYSFRCVVTETLLGLLEVEGDPFRICEVLSKCWLLE